ncbi:MAG: hypothetical protein ACI9AR_000069 [Flavobacteriaceae bacterium]|jgi:hypothetical protein
MKEHETKNNTSTVTNTEDAVPLPPETVSASETQIETDTHTYAEDMARALRDNRGSIISVAVAEHKRREEQTINENPSSKKNRLFIIFSIILIIATLGVGFLFIKELETESIPLAQTQDMRAIIPIDEAVELQIDSLQSYDIARALSGKIKEVRPYRNNIIYIAPTQKSSVGRSIVPTRDFLGKLQFSTPENTLQALDKNMLIGVFGDKSGDYPFLLLKNNSFFTEFTNSLRDWENGMLNDFFVTFDINVFGENAYLFNENFKDDTIRNIPARSLKNKEGEVILFYAFLDSTTLYISPYSEPLPEIIRRLSQ